LSPAIAMAISYCRDYGWYGVGTVGKVGTVETVG